MRSPSRNDEDGDDHDHEDHDCDDDDSDEDEEAAVEARAADQAGAGMPAAIADITRAPCRNSSTFMKSLMKLRMPLPQSPWIHEKRTLRTCTHLDLCVSSTNTSTSF